MISPIHQQRPQRRPAGIILLVVLSMLAFLGLLVVTYVAFSSTARRTADFSAKAESRSPDVGGLFEQAMLKLVRGTSDSTDPMYGESILADYYGHQGGLEVNVLHPRVMSNGLPLSTAGTVTDTSAFPARRPIHVGGGFVRFPVQLPSATLARFDDFWAGRVITFRAGPLEDQSFRVLRSIGARPIQASGSEHAEYGSVDSFFIELDPELFVDLADGTHVQVNDLLSSTDPHDVSCLFYAPSANPSVNSRWGAGASSNVDDDGIDGANNRGEAGYPYIDMSTMAYAGDDIPYGLYINPAPLNGQGAGYTAGTVSQNRPDNADRSTGMLMGQNVPVSFFPNRDKSTLSGDFDENYDAPDFNNWFLSGRVRVQVSDSPVRFEDRVIPSFHRPALINYLVNLKDWNTAVSNQDLLDIVDAYAEATFRPLPLSQVNGPLDSSSNRASENPNFTGGSGDFALSTSIEIPAVASPAITHSIARLDLLTNALVNGPWDVDNSGNGTPDSIWMDLGLPIITSREGKLLRPLIAPLIEDTSSKINLNTAASYGQTTSEYSSNPTGEWAGTTAAATLEVFRGSGYGPSEVAVPIVTDSELADLLRLRYRWGNSDEVPNTQVVNPVPGANGNDALDRLLNNRRSVHAANGGYGYSIDPIGWGGVGIGRSGRLLASVSGRVLQPAAAASAGVPEVFLIDEATNDPYEFDPTGHLEGDRAFSLAELEAILRRSSWDTDVLPQRLREVLDDAIGRDVRLAQMLTTTSSSTDLPAAFQVTGDRSGSSPAALLSALSSRLNLNLTAQASGETDVVYANRVYTENIKLQQLLAPELRLGRKLDVNRPLGNGIDDNGNGVIDEPAEFGNFVDDDADGFVDEVEEFRALISTGHNGVDDDSDTAVDEADERPTGVNYRAFPNVVAATSGLFGSAWGEYCFQEEDDNISGSGRELLARHLYVLMMALKDAGYNLPVLNNGAEIRDRNLYDARRLAQWAVNVVDFRDPDSIMTRFVYDPEPLNGWNINSPPDVVWGCESPELIFKESAAFHDVRVRDTKLERAGETGHTKGDPSAPMPGPTDEQDGVQDTDSLRIPQGSLFLELYVNRQLQSGDQASLQGLPRELLYRCWPIGPSETCCERN